MSLKILCLRLLRAIRSTCATEHSGLEKQDNTCPCRNAALDLGWCPCIPNLRPFMQPQTFKEACTTSYILTYMIFEADEGHENAGQMAPQVWPSSLFQRCYFHLFACGWTCKMTRGSTSRNPGISSTSKVPTLQIAPFAHSES